MASAVLGALPQLWATAVPEEKWGQALLHADLRWNCSCLTLNTHVLVELDVPLERGWAWKQSFQSHPMWNQAGLLLWLAYLCSRHLHQRLAVHTLLCALGICQILVFVMLHCSKPLYFSLKTNVCTSAAMSAVGISCRDQGKIPKIPKIRTWISIKTHLLLVESHSHYLYIWVGWWANSRTTTTCSSLNNAPFQKVTAAPLSCVANPESQDDFLILPVVFRVADAWKGNLIFLPWQSLQILHKQLISNSDQQPWHFSRLILDTACAGQECKVNTAAILSPMSM